MMDYSKEIRIAIQPEVTLNDTHHSPALELPEEVWLAIEAWRCIKDDDIARAVGKRLQEKINTFFCPSLLSD